MDYKIFSHKNITHLYISYYDSNMFPLQRTGTNLVIAIWQENINHNNN
jgi:hypothetical protein